MTELRLQIDKHRLDEEWEGQAVQFYYWAKQAADAQLKYDAAKSALSLKSAELDREIRNDPMSFDVGKITDKVAEKTIPLQPEYQAAERAVRQAYNELLHCKAAVDALEHRKRGLTMMVELYTREYYADSHRKGIRDLSEEEKQDVRARGQRRMQQREVQEEDREA